MRFERLRLAGFKSFVDPVELLFADGLTGIVGPNGCGKSNLLEALRWVMGETAPRALRVSAGGDGMEEVIFSGSSRRPARDHAEVTLVLVNDAGRAPAPWSREPVLEVTRSIGRGRGSLYTVNGREVRQRDIQTLFADMGTGAHAPALVSQGRVAALISARPEERRQLLEEAAGIAGLHLRRREAEGRLRAAEANLARLSDLIAEAEGRASALRRQARAAERYRALSERIRAAEAGLLHLRWRDAETARRAADAALAACEADLEGAVSAAARLSAEQANQAAALPALREAEARAAAAVQRLLTEKATLAAGMAATRQRLEDLDRAAAALAAEREREEARAEDARATGARRAAERQAAEAELAACRARLPDAEAAVAAAEAAAAGAEEALGAALEAQAALAAEARAAAAALAAARARLDRLDEESARLEAELARLRAGDVRAGTEAARAETEAALAAETARAGAAAAAAAEAERRARAASDARAAAAEALAAARAETAALEAELGALARQAAAASGSRRIPISAAPGLEQAVAAALGEDLDAAVGAPAEAAPPERRWIGVPVPATDPPLPEGVSPLRPHVAAPPELARRLAQIGLVEDPPNAGLLARLAPGQRLVSRAGWLWRWDGFVVPPGGRSAALAEALALAHRRARLEAALAGPRARAEAAAREAARQEALLRRAEAEERAARGERAEAERSCARLTARLRALMTALAEAEAREQALAAARARLAAERETAASEAAEAEAAVARLPDPGGAAEAAAEARARAERAREHLAEARAAAASTARRAGELSDRIRSLGGEVEGWAAREAASRALLAELSARMAVLAEERARLAERPAAEEAQVAALEAEIARAAALSEAAAADAEAAARALAETDTRARAAEARVADLREARAAAAAAARQAAEAADRLAAEAAARFGTHPRDLVPDAGAEAGALAATHARLLAERERLGMVNLRAGIELAELEAQLSRQTAEKAELETACARLRGQVGALTREGRARLAAVFAEVDRHFRALFSALFEGGQAELALTAAEDPLEAGLEIRAQPPGKRLQSLSLLSGGEQALTAIALLFALARTWPAPVCVLDEVDAPLDDANILRFSTLLERMAREGPTRYLVVTHNAMTMSRMDRLYGVTMAEPGVSQLVSVDLGEAARLAA